MLFYGSITVGVILLMVGLVYLFPQYGLKLLKASASKFWELLKPEIFKLRTEAEYKELNDLIMSGATKEEIREYERQRRRKKRLAKKSFGE